MTKFILAIAVAAFIIAGVWYMAPINTPVETQAPPEASSAPTTEQGQMAPQAVIIRYNGVGYEPSSVTIKKGASVTFVNDSDAETWPASAMHPTHAGYPETGGCLGSTFDACRGLKKGESWDFTFDFAGKWGYHDHLHARQFGSVTVEE